MAEGRDLAPRSPRWVNGLIWSLGLGAAACFVWETFVCNGAPACMPVGPATILTRVLGCAMLPLLVFLTMVVREARRVID